MYAQKFTGEVVYKYRATDMFNIDSLKQFGKPGEAETLYNINESLKEYQDSFEFNLVFNKDSSNYFWKEILGSENNYASIDYAKIFTASDSKFYTSLKDSVSLEELGSFDKGMIIKRILNEIGWKLSNESKQIGVYTCFKATAIKVNPKKRIVVEAWYTPQISNGFGPKYYAGLPGLILELTEGGITYYATSIKLNSKNEPKIKKPEKGKIITHEQLLNKYKEIDKSRRN
ncbi:MAG: GLPGLI family protein [Lutibacter sp.]|nr:GLPGLI family protein [Lutibacter sp.]